MNKPKLAALAYLFVIEISHFSFLLLIILSSLSVNKMVDSSEGK